MTFTLVKYSAPAWPEDKVFQTKADAAVELRHCICRDCRTEVDPIGGECLDADLLLSTPCGCEYGIEETANA